MRSPNMKNTLETVRGGKGIKCESKQTKNDNHAHNFKPKPNLKITSLLYLYNQTKKGKPATNWEAIFFVKTSVFRNYIGLLIESGLTIDKKRVKSTDTKKSYKEYRLNSKSFTVAETILKRYGLIGGEL
jgi:hypothetical protein